MEVREKRVEGRGGGEREEGGREKVEVREKRVGERRWRWEREGGGEREEGGRERWRYERRGWKGEVEVREKRVGEKVEVGERRWR